MQKLKNKIFILIITLSILLGGFFIFGKPTKATGPTYAGGEINTNTVWTKENSPYVILGSVKVKLGITLTIEPGVIVKFGPQTYSYGSMNYTKLVVLGHLVVQGTETEPIVFTSLADDQYGGDTNGDGNATNPSDPLQQWGSLAFYSSSNSVLENVIFRYGGHQGNGALTLDNSSFPIRNTLFENNSTALKLKNLANPTITQCQFKNNYNGAYIYGARGSFLNNEFSSNQTAVTAYQQSLVVFQSNNFINNNYLIKTDPNTQLDLENNTASGNQHPYIKLGGKITQDNTWQSDFPYFLDRDVSLRSGTLTIEPGTVIKFGPYYQGQWYDYPVNIGFYSSLVAQGTEENPIVFTSFADDQYGGDTGDGDLNYYKNHWGKIYLNNQSGGGLDYLIFRYGDEVVMDNSTVYFQNLILENNVAGLRLTNQSLAEILGSKIINNSIGLLVDSSSNLKINNSEIFGNRFYGILNASTTNDIDAKNNWWGDDSGPYHHTLNPAGKGNWVSNHVLFDPWIGKFKAVSQLSVSPDPFDPSGDSDDFSELWGIWQTEELAKLKIIYELKQAGYVKHLIKDENNQIVFVLSGFQGAGNYQLEWWGLDQAGNIPAEGNYTVLVQVFSDPEFTQLLGQKEANFEVLYHLSH